MAIEIVNVGPLMMKGDNMCFWPPVDIHGNATFGTPFCKVSETNRYVKLPTLYRTYQYLAAFTPEQLAIIPEFVNDICERNKMPKKLAPLAKRYEYDPAFFDGFKGVMCHTNWRPDKTDLAPVQGDPIFAALEKIGFSE